MLSEKSHTEKDKYCVILLTCVILKERTYGNREQIGGCQRGGGDG